jgi:hypothetical protein
LAREWEDRERESEREREREREREMDLFYFFFQNLSESLKTLSIFFCKYLSALRRILPTPKIL